MPNIATSLSYDVAGGHNFQLVAAVADLEEYGADDDLGYMVGGSVGLNLADVATLTFAASYSVGGAGLSHQYINGKTACEVDDNGDLCDSQGMAAGLGFAINETTSINVFGGYEEDLSAYAAGHYDNAWNVGGNIIWQPVKQMKMGWEVNYGEARYWAADSADRDPDVEALQIMWGTWFYF